MFGSAVVYSGALLALAGLIAAVRPGRRKRGLAVGAAGAVITAIGLVLPARESRVARAESGLDRFFPAWQFHEVHEIQIAAPPEKVYDAIRHVRADEILLFRTLTWIRRGGQKMPEHILNAAGRDSIIDVATRTTFLRLMDDTPRELVVGTVVIAPHGARGKLTPDVFLKPLPPGFATAGMNFAVRPDGAGGSIVTTETRVYANSPHARRRFAAYWRVIYPGSALIRRMWLRAIERRATTSAPNTR